MQKKLKNTVITLLIILLVSTSCHGNATSATATLQYYVTEISQQEIDASMDNLKQVIVNELSKQYDLLLIQVPLESTITLDHSWGSLELFKKTQDLTFQAIGTYDTHLETVPKENIAIDTENNRITVKLPVPSPATVNMDTATVSSSPSTTGMLRFGDIELTTEERNQLISDVTAQMQTRLTEQALYADQLPDVVTAIKKTISDLLQNSRLKDYQIQVNIETP